MSDRTYIHHLAEILRKAQGTVCDETGRTVDVGAEVVALRNWCDGAAREIERHEADLIDQAWEFQQATREMRTELERLQSATIHSCHANCQRVECVQGRALRKARAARMCQPGSDGWEEAQQAIADALGKAWPPVPGRE